MKLIRHPASPPSPAESVEVLPGRLGDGKLSLVFAVTGDIGRLRIPPATSGEWKDGLWRHSCFEAFVRLPNRNDYLELNLSPSGDWAAYRFDGYRNGMASIEIPPPTIRCETSSDQLGFVAGIDLADLEPFNSEETWQVGLSAVIEAEDGSLSYWALAHPLGPADFHHPDCFVLELPPAGEP